jgi:hypothetical protein
VKPERFGVSFHNYRWAEWRLGKLRLPELFEFAHHRTPKELRDFLRTFIREADEEQLRLATRLVKAIQL